MELLYIRNLANFWFEIGNAMKNWFIPIHRIFNVSETSTCKYLTVFHSTTDCDSIARFGGIGKKRLFRYYLQNWTFGQ